MTPERWRRIEDLYQAAIALPPDERVRFVADQCGGDIELRRDAESLLAQRSGGVLSEPAMALAARLFSEGGSSVLTGRRLGPYEVQARIGAGGMGEVYRARDTKLGREVAIKILPRRFTSDPDRVARFDREARVLAALNHPQIGAIHGVEDMPDGTRALILELVPGPTLADRLIDGPLPVADALTIAQQIADGIDAAHQLGIIHRDLKPANIKITGDGRVKVLDFGLAKLVTVDADEREPGARADAPTITLDGTRDGVLLGTAAYMSPEQARGQPLDKRTDIWSFGCVLYEMLTGRVAFTGKTVSDTLASILEREPDWSRLPATVPPSIRRLLERCLRKDRNERLRDIGDARTEIADALSGRHPSSRRARLTAALITLTAVALAIWFYVTRTATPITSPSEYVKLTNMTDAALMPSVSPDGRLLAFKRSNDSFFLAPGQIYVKVLPNGEAVRLTDSPRAKYGPVFTPDGSRVAYTELTGEGPSVSWDTWTVPVIGGTPTRLLPNASGLTWLPTQRVLFSEITGGLHMQIVTSTESRAESHIVYSPALAIGMAHYSYASPDLRSALIVEMGNTHSFDSPCRLAPLDGRSAGRTVGPPGMCYSAAWSPDGAWMYFAANVSGQVHLWRQKVPNGTPEQITSGITEESGIGVAPDGRSLITSIGRRISAIWLHDAAGEHAITSEGSASDAEWSVDGTRVFYLDADTSAAGNPYGTAPASELRVIDLRSGRTDSVLPGTSITGYDISRDGRDVVFTTVEHGESQVWAGPLNRSASPRRLARSADQVSFGAHGTVVFRVAADKTNFLDRMSLDGTGRERILPTPIVEKDGVSPDGEWVAAVVPLASDDQRLADPLAVPYDTMAIPLRGGPMRKVCNGGCRVSWSVDGRFLVVYSGASHVIMLPIPSGRSLPDLPQMGVSVGDVPNQFPNARTIPENGVSPGPDPSTYLFTRAELHANLFRIPLH
jgi:serine/threonine protein kinase